MEGVDGLLETVSLDEPHGIIRPAIAVRPQPVDRHNAGVFEPAGDLGFADEAVPTGLIIGVRVVDLLECHLAMQLAVERHEDGAQAP